jgi:hypothetical protein
MDTRHLLLKDKPSSRELALALWSGVDASRFRFTSQQMPVHPLEPISPDEMCADLPAAANLSGHPVPPSRSWFGKAFQVLRRLVKKCLNPWLEQQTQFNHRSVETFYRMQTQAIESAYRFNELLHHLQGHVEASLQGFNARLNDSLHEQHQFRLRVTRFIDQLAAAHEEQGRRLEELRAPVTAADEIQQLREALHQAGEMIEQFREEVRQELARLRPESRPHPGSAEKP